VLDVNGSLVSSDEINNYVLTKIKNGGTDSQIDVDNVYLIPHSSKPVNEYFNPKLLARRGAGVFDFVANSKHT
ncbi:unnamed protein product, partial [Adineta ricciae]